MSEPAANQPAQILDPLTERVLITGAGGFVGGWMVEEIASAWPGAQLFGTTQEAHAGLDFETPVTLIPCDITNGEAVDAAVARAQPTRVVHLAGMASGAGTDAARLRSVNAEAALTLVRAVARLGVPCRVLLASSGYVYGATRPGYPACEDDPLAAFGPYAESKAEMEHIVADWMAGEGRQTSVSVIIARAFNHTGPRQTEAFVIPAFARQIARIEAGLDEPIVRVGNLSALRDFLHVADVVRAYRLLLERAHATKPVFTVNVSSGEARSVQSLLDELTSLSHVSVDVQPDPARMRPVDLPECVGDPSLLIQATGWTRTRTISETLAETLAYWRKQVN